MLNDVWVMEGRGKLVAWWRRNISKTGEKEKTIKKFKLKSAKHHHPQHRSKSSVVVRTEKKRSWLNWLWVTLTRKNKKRKFKLADKMETEMQQQDTNNQGEFWYSICMLRWNDQCCQSLSISSCCPCWYWQTDRHQIELIPSRTSQTI